MKLTAYWTDDESTNGVLTVYYDWCIGRIVLDNLHTVCVAQSLFYDGKSRLDTFTSS